MTIEQMIDDLEARGIISTFEAMVMRQENNRLDKQK